MCGIVGLHLKTPTWEPQLGSLLHGMLAGVASRGPDSAGVALYRHSPSTEGSSTPELKVPALVTVASHDPGEAWVALGKRLAEHLGCDVEVTEHEQIAVFQAPTTPAVLVEAVNSASVGQGLLVLSRGHHVAVFKDLGTASAVTTRFGIPAMEGYQGLGHTRMATESDVSLAHSHPFCPSDDLCLVHNGSFSNHATVRRRLEGNGVVFDTDNDSEVAARYLAAQIAQGKGLADALHLLAAELDGFFTLAVTTADSFAVVRDAIACKPAVIVETDDLVAVASEPSAFAGLPGWRQGHVFEPAPGEVYLWRR